MTSPLPAVPSREASDLVKRLRTMAFAASRDIEAVLIEAADRIEALEAENERMNKLYIMAVDGRREFRAAFVEARRAAQQTVPRPDWEYIYRIASHEADRDNELVTVTRETARLASNALRKMNGEDFYDNNGAAERELMDALEAAAAQPSREAALVKALDKVRRWLGGMSFTPACAAEAEQLIADCTAALAKARGAP